VFTGSNKGKTYSHDKAHFISDRHFFVESEYHKRMKLGNKTGDIVTNTKYLRRDNTERGRLYEMFVLCYKST